MKPETATLALAAAISGLQKAEGKDGRPGPKGEKGDKGDKGDSIKGEKGDKGDIGPRGARGMTGERGQTGDHGFTGKDGRDGDDGKPGPKGPKGDRGEKGKDGLFTIGAPGQGVPIGGTSGQVLTKNSSTSYDTSWITPTGGPGGTVEWGDITGTLSDQTDLQAALDLKYDASNPSAYISNITGLVTQGTNVTITGTGTSGDPYVVNASDAAIGDVVGPASAVANNVVFFNGTTGKLIKDSGLTLSGSNTGDQTSVSGNAGTATALQNARNFSISGGGVTAPTVSFDGTAAVVLVPTLGAITPSSVAASGTVTGSNLSGTNTGDQTTISGNAGSATILQTARNFSLSGGGITSATVSFDGSAPVVLVPVCGDLTPTSVRIGGAASTTSFGYLSATVPAGATTVFDANETAAAVTGASRTYFNCAVSITGTLGMAGVTGMNFTPDWGSSGTLTAQRGCGGIVRNTGTGTVTLCESFSARIRSTNASGIITHGVHYNIVAPTSAGGTALLTGLNIPSLKVSGVTKAYAINSQGTTDLNVLAGSVRIGGTSDPTVPLDVTGAALFSSTVGITGALSLTVALTPANGGTGITALGTGVATALGVNVGSAGAFVTFNGALGTPSSGTLTNCTGLPIAGLVASTVTAIGVGSIELGHATDTTIARSGAGDITVEGNAVYRAGGTDVPVADGGTGGSTAAAARTNLGLDAGGAGDIWVEKAGDTMTGALVNTTGGSTSNPQVYLNGATNNWLACNTNGIGAPTFTTRSAGVKLCLYPAVAGASADLALGVEANYMWLGVDTTAGGFKFYGGTTLAATLSGTGALTLATDLAVTEGGTGSSTAAGARTNLGVDVVSISFIIDGGGATITTGIKGDLTIPFACTITEWTLLADQSGSVVVDIWKDTYANYPPVVGDSITASAKPTITTATKGQSSTLTGWTTSITAGDTLRFNVDSITTCQRVTLSLKVTRA